MEMADFFRAGGLRRARHSRADRAANTTGLPLDSRSSIVSQILAMPSLAPVRFERRTGGFAPAPRSRGD